MANGIDKFYSKNIGVYASSNSRDIVGLILYSPGVPLLDLLGFRTEIYFCLSVASGTAKFWQVRVVGHE